MSETLLCLDSGVWIKYLTAEEPVMLSDAAAALVLRGLEEGRLFAPGFVWAEVGSVLRKKVRQGPLQPPEADSLWAAFMRLPVEYVEVPRLRRRSWDIAAAHDLHTLYDSAILACAETVAEREGAAVEFWTTDGALLQSLGSPRATWIRDLAADA
jgi:predicted nucleic acid-binding protein